MEFISTSLPYKGAMSSLIGGRKENQDTVGYAETGRGLLLVVCDGMGGGPAGKTASAIATNAIIAYVRAGKPIPHFVENLLGIAPVAAPVPPEPLQSSDVPPAPAVPEPKVTEDAPAARQDNSTVLHDAVKYANACLNEAIALHPAFRGMGTTATAVLIDNRCAVLAHVGDSRIYQLRSGHIVFRTADHSFVGQLVRDGKLTEEQARLSAKSNIITRALGVDNDVDVDIDVRPYEKGDRFVLCTDGIWGAMPQPELVKELSQKAELGGVLDSLNSSVDTIGHGKGGHHDNFSAIIMETKINSILKEQMSTKIKITGIILAAVCFVSIIVNIVLFATRESSTDTNVVKNLTMQVDSLRSANDSLAVKLSEANERNIQNEMKIQKVLTELSGDAKSSEATTQKTARKTGKKRK